MADGTAIEWTDATWNPATGCSKVSPGCKNCYAEPLAKRLKRMGQKKYTNGFDYTEHPDDLNKPLTWKKPKKIFVNSMSDLFHEKATPEFITNVFDTMMLAKQHTYQILTKRPPLMSRFVLNYLIKRDLTALPNHIWIGTSVELAAYENRIDVLRNIPAAVHFVSFEPLLGPIVPYLKNIQWVIVGGESGKHHRPIETDWVLKIYKACRQYGTAFFFKQWGGEYPKANGRELNGITYNEFPTLGQQIIQ